MRKHKSSSRKQLGALAPHYSGANRRPSMSWQFGQGDRTPHHPRGLPKPIHDVMPNNREGNLAPRDRQHAIKVAQCDLQKIRLAIRSDEVSACHGVAILHVATADHRAAMGHGGAAGHVYAAGSGVVAGHVVAASHGVATGHARYRKSCGRRRRLDRRRACDNRTGSRRASGAPQAMWPPQPMVPPQAMSQPQALRSLCHQVAGVGVNRGGLLGSLQTIGSKLGARHATMSLQAMESPQTLWPTNRGKPRSRRNPCDRRKCKLPHRPCD